MNFLSVLFIFGIMKEEGFLFSSKFMSTFMKDGTMAKDGTLWLSRGYSRCTTYNQLAMSEFDVICSLKLSMLLWL